MLCLICDGRTTKEISQILGITCGQVAEDRVGIGRKLGTTAIALWVRYAVRAGLIDP